MLCDRDATKTNDFAKQLLSLAIERVPDGCRDDLCADAVSVAEDVAVAGVVRLARLAVRVHRFERNVGGRNTVQSTSPRDRRRVCNRRRRMSRAT